MRTISKCDVLRRPTAPVSVPTAGRAPLLDSPGARIPIVSQRLVCQVAGAKAGWSQRVHTALPGIPTAEILTPNPSMAHT